TLWAYISGSGVVDLVPNTMYPLTVPQQPSDFTQPPPPQPDNPRARRPVVPPPTSGGGRWLSDWSGPPVSAYYLAAVDTASQTGVLVLYGWVYDLSRGTAAEAQVIKNRYLGSLDE